MCIIVKMLVFRAVWRFRRRIAEGSPKGRRKRILADINARPPNERKEGELSRLNRDTQWKGGGRRIGTGRRPRDGGHGMPGQGTKGRDGVGGRGETATHSGRDGAGREKKEKAPKEKEKKKPQRKRKAPNKKEKTLLAAPLAYGRLRRPPLLLLFSLPSAAAPPPFIALSALLSPLVGGCAAPPLCFSSRASFGRLRRLSLPRALVGG